MPDGLVLQPFESSVGRNKGGGVSVKDQLGMGLSQGVPGSAPPCRWSGKNGKGVCSRYVWGT